MHLAPTMNPVRFNRMIYRTEFTASTDGANVRQALLVAVAYGLSSATTLFSNSTGLPENGSSTSAFGSDTSAFAKSW